MPNSKVALLRYVRIARGWRRLRVQPIRRGRGWGGQESSYACLIGMDILRNWVISFDGIPMGNDYRLDQDIASSILARPPASQNLGAEALPAFAPFFGIDVGGT